MSGCLSAPAAKALLLPNGSLLLQEVGMEWMASSESQKIADDQEPMGSSHLFRGGGVEQELRGKKLSWVNWEQHVNMESWMAKLFQAYGFPNAQR